MIDATPLVKQYSTFRLRQLKKQHVADIQKAQLLALVKKAQSTLFGKQYHFKDIRTVEDYQRTVPLRTYDDFWRDFWSTRFPELIDCTWPGKIPFFALSSGTTTDKAKNVPVTKEMITSNSKASFDLFCHHFRNNPRSNLLGGKGFMLGGISAPLTQLSHNVYEGVLPAILLTKTMPWWVKPWYLPSIQKLARIPNWEEKFHTIAQELLHYDMRSLSGFPAWLLILFKKLQEEKSCRGDFRIVDYFPNLEMLVPGGESFTPYLTQFSNFLEGSHCELREIYATSEGFIAIADRQSGQGLRLICDRGIFYEFIPLDELHQENPSRYWIDNVRVGTQYAIVLSTCAGLWSYILGDIIQFVDLDPPRILIPGRTSNILSIFGEQLLEEEVCQAIATAADTIGVTVTDFTVGAPYPQNIGDRGKHIYIVEFQNPPTRQEDILRFTETIDQTLSRHNTIYDGIHLDGNGLDTPELYIAAPGTFQRWLKSRGKPEGKVPRIIADTEKFNTLLTFVREYRSGT